MSDEIGSYYEMLRKIPKEERDKRGLTDEYLKQAEKSERNIMKFEGLLWKKARRSN